MNFELKALRFTARWIPIFLMLLFVAPHARARQDETPSPAQTPAPKPPKNARPTDSQRPTTQRQNGGPNTRTPSQADHSPNEGSQNGKRTNTDKPRGSENSRPDRVQNPSSAQNPAQDGPSNPRPDDSQHPTRPSRDNRPTSRPPVQGGMPTNPDNPRGSENGGLAGSGNPSAPSSGQDASSNPRPSIDIQPDSRPGRGSAPSSKPSGQPGTPTDSDKTRGSGYGRPSRPPRPSSPAAAKPDASNNSHLADDKDPARPDKDKTFNTKPSGNVDAPTNSDKPRGPRNSRPDSKDSMDAGNKPESRPSRTVRANGTVIERGKNGRTTLVTTPRGTTAKMDTDGRITSIRDKRGNTISRGPRGERRVETVRPDQSRVVSIGQRGGFVERGFNRGGRPYVQRTYVIGRHTYVSVYRGYHYHGMPYYWYVPPFYYSPAYYWWAYNPWPRPIYYTWGWYGSPWYRPYGYYFAPYPAYPYASLWLTDYVLAENLRLAYEADESAGIQPDHSREGLVMASYHPGKQVKKDPQEKGSVVLTPEVKQMIAEEVKAVIADNREAASTSSSSSLAISEDQLPAALDPNHRVFVAFSVLEVTANGETCSLTSSDVVKRTEDTPDDDNSVATQVLASKKSDCAVGSSVRIQTTDLNDMQNHLREQIDAGMKVLSEKQGKDGLPAAPPAKPRAVAEGTAEADPTAAADLREQVKEADQTEKEVQQEASSDPDEEN